MKSRLGDKELAHDAFFTNMKVPEVQQFLKERNIRISVNWRLLRGACDIVRLFFCYGFHSLFLKMNWGKQNFDLIFRS